MFKNYDDSLKTFLFINFYYLVGLDPGWIDSFPQHFVLSLDYIVTTYLARFVGVWRFQEK